MAAALRCPVCAVALPEGGTHCPRCGLRVAALERPGPRVERDRPAWAPLLAGTLPAALTGVAAGVALLAVFAVVSGLVALDGPRFGDSLGNASVVAGGLLAAVAVVLGGVRIRRWAEYDDLRRRARGEDGPVPGTLRVTLGVAALVLLAVGVALAVTR